MVDHCPSDQYCRDMATGSLEQVRQMGLLAVLPVWAFSELAPSLQVKSYETSEQMLDQHGKATTVSLLLAGDVDALISFEDGAEFIVESINEPGALLGWSAFRPPYRYTASIRFTSPGSAIAIPAAALYDIFARSPELEFQVLQEAASELAQRLRNAQRQMQRADTTAPNVTAQGHS